MTHDTSQPDDTPREHMYYPDLPCWCGGMPAFGVPHQALVVAGRGTPDGLDGADAELILEAHDLAERNYDL